MAVSQGRRQRRADDGRASRRRDRTGSRPGDRPDGSTDAARRGLLQRSALRVGERCRQSWRCVSIGDRRGSDRGGGARSRWPAQQCASHRDLPDWPARSRGGPHGGSHKRIGGGLSPNAEPGRQMVGVRDAIRRAGGAQAARCGERRCALAGDGCAAGREPGWIGARRLSRLGVHAGFACTHHGIRRQDSAGRHPERHDHGDSLYCRGGAIVRPAGPLRLSHQR